MKPFGGISELRESISTASRVSQKATTVVNRSPPQKHEKADFLPNMATSKKKPHKPKSLSHGRPVTAKRPTASLSSKATRTLIRTHHQLEKTRAKAIRDGDSDALKAIEAQQAKQGGLKSYQQASITGQSLTRGGDSSKVLLQWLSSADMLHEIKIRTSPRTRVLEVGALSPSNAVSLDSAFEVTRIDLHSQHPRIETQDFMARPLPVSDKDKFDIISLSLVLNYVPDAKGRGEMLKRTCQFLRTTSVERTAPSSALPSLFLVLPAPCVTNSRYLTEERLTAIMESLGYTQTHRKLSDKLVYYVWKLSSNPESKPAKFTKKEVNPGVTRNNFSIVLP